jgi:hypothetical protein
MASLLVAEGYALSDILDYDNGMPFEELQELHRHAQRGAIVRRKSSVEDQTTALAALFDKKALSSFRQAVNTALRELKGKDESREEQMDHTWRELRKLQEFLGGPKKGDRPPWERGGK